MLRRAGSLPARKRYLGSSATSWSSTPRPNEHSIGRALSVLPGIYTNLMKGDLPKVDQIMRKPRHQSLRTQDVDIQARHRCARDISCAVVVLPYLTAVYPREREMVAKVLRDVIYEWTIITTSCRL